MADRPDDAGVPTWLIERGYRFGAFAADCRERPHVHVHGKGGEGKVCLATGIVVYLRYFDRAQQAEILAIIKANRRLFQERWDAFCGERQS